MGTDIHLYVEKFDGEKWVKVDAPYDTGCGQKSWSPYYKNRDFNHGEPDPTNRNYNVFAFIAGVRNGYGFAGCPRHKPIIPAFEGRGLPEPTSFREAVYDDDWDIIEGDSLGDHSFTWATLSELRNLNWGIEFESSGVVDIEQYRVYKRDGCPQSWSGDVSGRLIRKWDEDVFASMVESGKAGPYDYTRVYWKWQPLKNCGFRRWLDEILAPMFSDHDRVRVLIGFDS